MELRPKIVIIHPNSLCCLAMRTILSDIAPFMGMLGDVEVLSYNSMEEFAAEEQHPVVHFFVDGDTAEENLSYFKQYARRCIVLVDGEHTPAEGFRTVDVRKPERELLKSFFAIHNNAHSAHVHPSAESPQPDLLSQREKEVLTLMVKGYINKEIADKLHISTPTVIFHRKNIVEKVGSKSLGRLTIYAVMNGIVDFKEL